MAFILKCLFYFAFILVLFYLNILSVNSFIFERPLNTATANIFICESLIVMKSNLPLVKQSTPIELVKTLNSRKISCVNGGTLLIKDVSYGKQDSKKCPKPSALVIQSDFSYCQMIRNFFSNLRDTCNAPARFLFEIRNNYGDFGSNICAQNQSVPIYAPNDFCTKEIFNLIADSSKYGIDGNCAKTEFLNTFNFCNNINLFDASSTIELWQETSISTNLVKKICSGRETCEINLDQDFPNDFSSDTFYSQYLDVNYRCLTKRVKFRPNWYKRTRMLFAAANRRFNRPPEAQLKLSPLA